MSGKQNGFSKIPLARKIEALVLTAVTVIASASVDWSSLTARANGGDTLNQNYYSLDTSSTTSPSITMSIGGYEGNENAGKYRAVKSAYMNIQIVSGSADYVATVYQNPADPDDYTTGVAHQVKTGTVYSSTDNTQEDPEPFQPKELWNYPTIEPANGLTPPVYLSSTETATIVVTFSNISEGAQIQYGTDSENNPFALSEEAVNSFDDAQIISKISQITAVTDEAAPGQSYDLSSNNIYLEPAYNRTIDLTLLSGIKTAGQIAVSDLNSSITITDQAAIDDNFILTPKATGENTIVAFSGENKVAIPLRVVDPKINYSAAVYTGAGFHITEPAPVCGNNTLTSGMDFYATYSGTANDGQTYTAASADQITKAGKYTVTLTGAGNYAGLDYTSPEFTIGTRDLSDKNTGIAVSAGAMVIDPATREVASYAGALTDNGTPLILGTDYTAEITRDQTSATKFSVKITGINNYSGERTFETTATTDDQIDLNTMVKGLMLTASQSDTANVPYYAFDGKPHNEPGIFFYDDEAVTHQFTLTKNTDYAYSIEDRNGAVVYDSAVATSGGAIEAGDYTVKIRGLNNYKGTISSQDYKVSDGNGGTRPQVLTIAPTKLTPGNIIVKLTGTTQFVANGNVQQPSGVTVDYVLSDGTLRRLNENVDYTKTFPQSVTKGNYSVTITGMGNFTADSVNFGDPTIKDQINTNSNVVYTIVDSLDAATITLKLDTQAAGSSVTKDNANTSGIWESAYETPYNGASTRTPEVTVNIGTDLEELKSDNSNKDTADYQVIYNTDSSKKAGTATLTVRGMNRFAGQPDITVSYTITPKTLPGLTIDSASQTKTYSVSGSGIKLDYGSYHVKDNGSELTAANLTSAELAAPKADEIAAKYPDADYYVTYENNKNAGNATVTAHGINNYAGETTATFTIEPLSLQNNNDFAIDPIPDQSYNYGAAVEPDKNNPDQVVVKYKGWYTLVKGTDYTLSYSGNTDKGKATVKVKGIGNFADDLSANFTIKARSLVDTTITYTIGGGTNKKTGTVTTQNLEPGYRTEYTGDKITPAIELKSGDKTLKAKDKAGTVKNPDYELDYGSDTVSAVGDHTVTVKGLNNYAGNSIIFTYTVTRKDFSTESFVVVPVTTATSTSIVAGVGAIKRYYQVKVNGKVLTPQVDANKNTNATYDYSVKWTEPGASTTLGSNVIPSLAGEGYTLQITGRGNYKGTSKPISLDSNQQKLMVGASVDAVDVINILGRSNYSVPYLGSNLPAVYLESDKLTSKTSSVNPYNQNIVVSGNSIALAGPDYENGQYQNGTAKDYTVHFVPGTTASKDDAAAELSSLPVNTQFKVRVSAVAGSKLFFGSHQTEHVFTVSATDLSDFGKKTTGYPDGRLTVSDTAVAEPYVVSNGSVVSAAAISYEYTGSTITPKLSVTFTPVTPASSKFNGTFAPINLLSYATVAPASIEANVASNQNFTLTANTGSGFSGTLNIPYEVTQKKITEDMITMSPTSTTYDGTSKKSVIEKAVTVTYNTKALTEGSDYTLKFYTDKDKTKETELTQDSDFVSAKSIYIEVSGTGTNFDTTSVMYPDPFVIKGKSLSSATLTLGGDVTKPAGSDIYYAKYNGGNVVSPTVIVTDGSRTLSGTSNKSDPGKDYYYDPTSADSLTQTGGVGLKTVTVKGLNNYSGDADLTESFYVYGTLTKDTNSTDADAFRTSDIADGKQLILDENGNTVTNDVTKSAFDYTKVVFKHGTDSLTYGTHFTAVLKRDGVPVSDMSVPGIYTITYTGTGYRNGCYGTVIFNNITVKGDLQYATIVGSKDNLAIDGRNYDFAGKGNNPGPQNIGQVTVKLGSYNIPGEALKFSVASIDNRDYVPGDGADATITIEPNTSSTKYGSLYTGSVSASYNIRYDLSKVTISKKSGETLSMTDDVDILKSKIVVTWKGQTLTQDTDYTFDPQPSWTSTGSNATPRLTFTLQPDANLDHSYGSKSSTALTGTRKPLNKDTENVSMTTPQSTNTQEYDGQDHFNDFAGNVEITYDGETLNQGTDYAVQVTKQGSSTSLKAGDMVNVGTYELKIRGVGNYKTDAGKELKATYTITSRSLKDNSATMELTDSDDNQLYYSGTELNPEYTVTDDLGNVLTKDDYTIKYTASDWNAGTEVTVTVSGKNNYKDDITDKFTIRKVSLDSTLIKATSTAVYNGQKQTPTVTVQRVDDDGTVLATLSDPTDYKFTPPTDQDLTNVGNHTCSISAGTNKNYTGTKDFEFIITPRSLTSSGIEVILDNADGKYAYANGDAVTPTVTITDTGLATGGTTPLVSGTDYTATPANNTVSHSSDNTDGAAPVVQIIGNGNYGGEVDKYFQIGTDLSDATVTLDKSTHGYDGAAFRPTVTGVTLNGNALTETTDYTGPTYTTTGGAVLAATEPTSKGTYKATVTGTGAYFGTASAEYTITAKETDWAALTVKLKDTSANIQKDGDELFYYYSGQQNKPDVEVYYDPGAGETPTLLTGGEAENAAAAQSDWDYYLTYGENTNAGVGAGTVTVHLINNYQDSDGDNPKSESFDIRAIDISDTSKFKLTFDGDTKVAFTGDAIIKPFTLSGTNAAGQDVSVKFDATDADALKTQADAAGITATWSANIAPGTAHLRVTGMDSGNFTGGPLDADLIIKGNLSTLPEDDIEVSPTYRTGSKVTPAVKINFKDNSGNNHYIDTSWFEVNATPYQGTWQTAEKLTVGIKVTSAGKDFLEGTRTVDGKLTDEPQGLTISGYNNVYSYTGAKLTPESELKVMMDGGDLPATMKVKGFNFYSSKDGTACVIPGTVTMSAIVTYTDKSGTEKEATVTEGDDGEPASYRIIKRAIKNCTITGIGDMLYDGKAHEPDVKVSAGGHVLERYVDYNLAYSGNKDPGTATITVKATKNADSYFVGQTTVNYTIYVANVTGISTTSSSTTSATASWKASSYVNGYKIVFPTKTGGVKGVLTTKTSYTMTDLDPDDSTQVQIQAYVNGSDGKPAYYGPVTIFYAKTILPSTTATVSATSTGINTISWAGITNAQGYEIWRSTSADTGYVMLTTARSAVRSYVDQKATSGVKYYYRVRGYKYDSTGVKYGYSDYSPAVYVTTR